MHTNSLMRNDDGSIILLGCFSSEGTVMLIIDGKMDGAKRRIIDAAKDKGLSSI